MINAIDTGSPTAGRGNTLVIGHGLGSGLGFFFDNIDAMAGAFDRVIAFDWLGFGGSSRPVCSAAPRRRSRSLTSLCASDGDFASAAAAASFFTDSFHEFIHHPEIGLADKRFTLLAHSMGGFLAGTEVTGSNGRCTRQLGHTRDAVPSTGGTRK